MTADTLPDGWTTVRFDEMAAMVSERVNPADAQTDVYVGLEHLDPESLRIRSHGAPSDVSGDKLRFRKGHILFGKRRAYQRKLAVAEVDGICSAHAMVLTAKPEVVHPDFLPFFMQSDLFMDRAVQISVGGLSPTINWKTLRAQTFALPPMERQAELVELFRGVEDVVERQNEAARAIEALRRSVLFDLLEPRPEWEVVRLDSISDLQRGQRLAPEMRTGKNPKRSYLRAANIQAGQVDFSDINEMDFDEKAYAYYRLKPRDVLLVEANAVFERVGDAALYTESMPSDLCYQMTLIRVRRTSDSIDPDFFYYLFRYLHESESYRGVAGGNGILHLSTPRVSKMRVSIPDLAHQRRAATVMAEIDRARERVRDHGESIRKTKEAVVTEALTSNARLGAVTA